MSVEKLKIFKKVKGADNYTKNPIIDSLIRQKLQSEMIVIKDQFHQIISKEQNLQKQPKQQVSMRRKMSTHNLGSISSSKIRESLNYKHSYERSALQFIIQRQKASPFFTIQDIEANNIGRTNFNEFANKLNSSDILTYPSHPGSTNHLKTILPLDIWLNQLPEVEQIIRKRAEQLQKDHSNPNVYPFKFNYNNRPGTQILQPIKSRLSTSHKSLEKHMELQPNEITYEHRRYHKNDYKGLESWLQNMNEGMNKKFGNGGQQEMKQHLNQTYKVYLSAIKELIRLTYIESAEKGLLLEKIMWSFIRLFQELISEQHRLNYEEFKLYRDETKDLQKDFSQRKGYLEKEVEKYKKTVNQLVQKKRNIYLSYLSYKKVNQEMNREIQKLVGEIKLLNSQNNFLISNLSKIIQEFQSRDIINTKKEDQFTVYYYLNSQDQIQVVAKTPNKQLLDQYFQSSMTSFNLDIINKQQKHDQRIDQLDNQLIAYWDKKRAYLDLDQIIDKNNQPEIADAFVQADGRGPNIYQQVATQFPDQNELNFEDFLREEMQLERKGWQQKQEEYKSTTFELRQIYSQAQEQIQLLTDKNKKLKQSIIEKDRELNYIGRQLQQFDQQIPLLNQKIFMLQQQIISTTQNQRIISQQSAKIQQFLELQTNKYIQEKQNNSLLAANIFHLKVKVEKLEVLSTSLQNKIKLLAPHLQRMMALAEQSQSEVLIKLSALVQQHLKDYVEKDSKVFLTY